MPRTADHDVRRKQMADATHRLIAHTGLDSATMAAVAREAGFSVGLVQHYFGSKDELLLFAYRQMTDDQLARVGRLVAEGEADRQPIRAILLRCLPELWPLDADRRGEYRVSKAFHARALDVPAVAEVARETAFVVRGQIARAVANGKECGEVEASTDAQAAALELSALIAGLADELYREPEDRRLEVIAEALFAARLAAYFPGECRHYGR
ncbi:TetR/AcrR family transcriptional regulator [Glycomyces paridis]|uniref:TetR/AcrR family transcriptional regulator n=1 Tax=Glycomyces paridis TaxID=2126555 RepID=A0A4S8P9P6_9ACTN|nr:TetR/AcrR family transcriptional regulator [Glycomyces paridis]THV26421.1 TetR/AcrR family transcriptional regulator [Glycomyces paridis]